MKNNSINIKEALLALYSNIALSNIKDLITQKEFENNFKNNIQNDHNIKKELKSSLGKSEPIITDDDLSSFLSSDMFSWLTKAAKKLRNYYSHEKKEHNDNNEKLKKHFDDKKFNNFKNIIKIYLNLDTETLSNSDIIYEFIIISMFLLKNDIKLLKGHLKSKNYKNNFGKNELETLQYLFSKKGLINKVTKLRLISKIDKEKIERSSYQVKSDVLHNFFHNLKTESKGKVKFNNLATKLLNELLISSKSNKYRFISLYNKNITNINKILNKYNENFEIKNFWSIKDKPCKFNYIFLVNIKNNNFEYHLLNQKYFKNLILNFLDKKESKKTETIISEIIESNKKNNPMNETKNKNKSWKLDNISNHFKEILNHNKLNSLKTLKMLNKILLAESNIKSPITAKNEYDSKLNEINQLAPSYNDFFALKFHIDNNNLEKTNEFIKKIYIDKDESTFKDLKLNDGNILNQINSFITNYIKNNKKTLLDYYNSEWVKNIKIYTDPKGHNSEFTLERNKKLLIVKRNESKTSDDSLKFDDSSKFNNKTLYNHIFKWRPILLLANRICQNLSTDKLKEFNDIGKIWKQADFKWIDSRDYNLLVENTKKLIGKVLLPKEIIDIQNNDNDIRSNLSIYNSQLYKNFTKLLENKEIKKNTKDLIKIVNQYKEKELEIIQNTYRLESKEEIRWLRNAIFHRLELNSEANKKLIENWDKFIGHINIKI